MNYEKMKILVVNTRIMKVFVNTWIMKIFIVNTWNMKTWKCLFAIHELWNGKYYFVINYEIFACKTLIWKLGKYLFAIHELWKYENIVCNTWIMKIFICNT